MMSKQEMLKPIIKNTLAQLNCPITHNGLDIKIKADQIYIDPFNRGPNSYEIMHNGRAFGSDTYPSKSISHLIDDVIIKYFEAKGSVKNKSQELTEEVMEKFKTFHIADGKYLSKIVETETGYDFYTHSENDITPEVKQISADLFHLLAIAKNAIDDKTQQVNNQMKIGTLDSNKNTKELLIHTANGPEVYTKDIVPQRLLLTTLWYMLKLHQSSKLFLDHINLEVEYKSYKAKIIKGEVHLETEGQSQLVKDIYQDLRRME